MNDKIRKLLITIFTVIAIIAIGFCVFHYVGIWQRTRDYENNKDKVVNQEKVPEKKPEQQEQVEEPYVSPIDFKKLQEQNPDVYAWIQIPGTNVDYPILQHPTDNAYYLDHTIDKKEGLPGSIYTENYNKKDFTDFNTLIYGHDMRNGTMFRDLHNYKDINYMKEHSELIIYTPEKKMVYQIFAAVVYNDMHIMAGYDFSDETQREMFLDSIYSSRDMRNAIDDSVQIQTSDRILTLSTCIGSEKHHRYLVEAVLKDE